MKNVLSSPDASAGSFTVVGDSNSLPVVVVIEKDGNRFIGRGQSTDVVEASIKAYINGINRLYSN